MAINLWGKIYYKDTFAGILSQEAGGRCVFTYDESYLQSSLPAISYTLPLRAEPHLSEYDCSLSLTIYVRRAGLRMRRHAHSACEGTTVSRCYLPSAPTLPAP